MVKKLVHDPAALAQRSRPAVADDLSILQDLLDTLQAHKQTCVGMAANMIGENVCIIAFDWDGRYFAMLNPQIIDQTGPFEAEESCLSYLGGPRKTLRYQRIKVRFETPKFQTREKIFSGFTAQIIQHEIDHCNGILI